MLVSGLLLCGGALGLRQAKAAQPEPHAEAHAPVKVHKTATHESQAPATTDAQTQTTAEKVRAALARVQARHAPKADSAHATPAVNSRAYARAKAVALAGGAEPSLAGGAGRAGHVGNTHWSYGGDTGPQNWSTLQPEFDTCASGQRQSPIHIEESATLPGPAEPLQFNYQASSGSVVNNGHTIQVDVQGDNTLMVRGSVYRLVQFHFHHPAEEKINHKGFSMVVHLVHKNAAGKLAVVAVLMDPGATSPLVEKVWTHMPLDVADRVQLPVGLIQLGELLPQDQRYYQFFGSLTTPPCTEGVLWMILKQPMTLSRDQLRLFAQLFPNNARPIQAANNRIVRDAM